MVRRASFYSQASLQEQRQGRTLDDQDSWDLAKNMVSSAMTFIMMIASNMWNTELVSLEREEDVDWLKKNAIVVEVGSVPLWKQ